MNHNDQAKNAKGYSVWIVKTDDGIEREFTEVQDIPVIEKLIKNNADTELRYQKDDAILRDTLNALGIERDDRHTNMFLLCQTLLHRIVMAESGKDEAIESVDGYIKSRMVIKDVFASEYLNQFTDLVNGCYQVIDGKIVLDEEKRDAIIGTL